METLTLALGCCGRMHLARCNSDAIARFDPNERKQNFICPGCGSLVILTFRCADSEVLVENQEIIDLGTSS